jgi:hypothetical protein
MHKGVPPPYSRGRAIRYSLWSVSHSRGCGSLIKAAQFTWLFWLCQHSFMHHACRRVPTIPHAGGGWHTSLHGAKLIFLSPFSYAFSHFFFVLQKLSVLAAVFKNFALTYQVQCPNLQFSLEFLFEVHAFCPLSAHPIFCQQLNEGLVYIHLRCMRF